VSSLAATAQRVDEAVRRARAELVRAVREAAAAGMSQRDIAAEIGRSQPEVSRLIRFHGSTPLGQRLRASRSEVLDILRASGARDVRVFGSVAAEQDREGSDIDLLFTMTRPLGLLELEALEDAVSAAVGARVDLVPDETLLPRVASRVVREAVPL
jgi:uncharacterized protein